VSAKINAPKTTHSALARPTLQHRLILNYRAEAEGVRAGELVDRLLATVTP